MNRRQFVTATGVATLGWPLVASAQEIADRQGPVRLSCRRHHRRGVAARGREAASGGYAKVALVDNKAGAGGRLAVEELKRSPADGWALLLTPAAMITLYPHIYTKLATGIDDVTPVCTACQIGFGFGVGPVVPESVKNLKDFLAWAKANPDAGQLRLARRRIAAAFHRRAARKGSRPATCAMCLTAARRPASRTCSAGKWPR